MFKQFITVSFEAYLKTSLGMIPFLLMILLLENRFRKQYSAIWKYQLFLLIVIRMLIPVVTGQSQTMWLHMPSVVNYSVQKSKEIQQNDIALLQIENAVLQQHYDSENTEQNTTIEQNQNTAISQKSFSEPQKINIDWLTVLAYSWFAIVLAQLLFFEIQYIIYCKKIKRWRSKPIQNSTIELYQKICSDMGIRKIPNLWICHAIESPMCFGLFQKGIYITKEDMPLEQLEMILKHELCHYKRKDLKYQYLCILVRTIYFYNYIVIAFLKIVERDIELSCDDMVMKYCEKGSRKEYSTMILSMMRENIYKNTVFSICFVKEKNVMKKRFENILDTSPKKTGKLLFFVLSLFVLLSYGLSYFGTQQQSVLLFYLFNLFVFASFCFLMSTKQKKRKILCAMMMLFVLVNGCIVGCSQNVKNTVSEVKQKRAQQYSDEQIERLLKWKSHYVGYSSAIGNLLSELGSPDGMEANGYQIQSKQEPYGVTIYFDIKNLSKVESGGDGSVFGEGDSQFVMKDDVYFQFDKISLILFSLIKNLSYIDYDISYQNEPFLSFRAEKWKYITYSDAVPLFPVLLDSYTDSVESYRYFLDYVDGYRPVSRFGYEQWQKEIDDALQQIIYNEKVATHSDTQYYIDHAPNDSYNKIVQKGEQALCYFLERFEEGTAKGLRGEIMMRVCQDILGKSVVVQNYDTAQQWHEQYDMTYHGRYPLYSSIVEKEQQSDNLILKNKKQVFTALERELRGENSNMFCFKNPCIYLFGLELYSPVEGILHEYQNEKKVYYYGKLQFDCMRMIEQNKGKVLFFEGEGVLPVKVIFVEREGEMILEEVNILRTNSGQTLEMFCAEDKQMIQELSGEPRYDIRDIADVEKELKQYVTKNNIDAQYYCIDHKTLQEF